MTGVQTCALPICLSEPVTETMVEVLRELGRDEVADPRGAGAAHPSSRRAGAKPSPLLVDTLWRRAFSRASVRRRPKRVRGGAGKPAPPQRKGEPQRGERQVGRVAIGFGRA